MAEDGRRDRAVYSLVMEALVICIGNKARGDDGVGRLVGELLESELPAGTVLINEPLLDIVMAEEIAQARFVAFVDAQRRHTPAVAVDDVVAGTAGTHPHGIDPAGLLALAHTLYGASPPTVLVSVAGPEMDHGEGLSETARAASKEAARVTLDLVSKAR